MRLSGDLWQTLPLHHQPVRLRKRTFRRVRLLHWNVQSIALHQHDKTIFLQTAELIAVSIVKWWRKIPAIRDYKTYHVTPRLCVEGEENYNASIIRIPHILPGEGPSHDHSLWYPHRHSDLLRLHSPEARWRNRREPRSVASALGIDQKVPITAPWEESSS